MVIGNEVRRTWISTASSTQAAARDVKPFLDFVMCDRATLPTRYDLQSFDTEH